MTCFPILKVISSPSPSTKAFLSYQEQFLTQRVEHSWSSIKDNENQQEVQGQ